MTKTSQFTIGDQVTLRPECRVKGAKVLTGTVVEVTSDRVWITWRDENGKSRGRTFEDDTSRLEKQ